MAWLCLKIIHNIFFTLALGSEEFEGAFCELWTELFTLVSGFYTKHLTFWEIILICSVAVLDEKMYKPGG